MQADPAFPSAHLRPATGWVNDPNGPFRWRDRYHLFFQHNPAGPMHGDICWGHVSSADLTTWRQEPVALVPTPGGPDSGGCWSGCVVDDDGVATAVYTGLVDDPRVATVCLAYAEDDALRRWRKNATPVALPPPGVGWLGFRDPFLFDVDGHRYAVVGAGALDGHASVLVYSCDDLHRWEHRGDLLDGRDPVASVLAPAEIWECPQLVRLADRWVLIVSLVHHDSLTRVAYLVGDVTVEDGAPRFLPSAGGLVDSGHDFYAPAVLVMDGRVLLWGWTWEDRDAEEVLASGWAGALTWPRELGLTDDGRLVSSPAREVEGLRTASAEPAVRDGRLPLPPGPVEVELSMDGGGVTTVSLSQAERPGVVLSVDPGGGRVSLRRTAFEESRRPWTTEGTLPVGDRVDVRLVVDGSVVEVYVAGGPVFTERVYPTAAGAWVLGVEGPSAPGCKVAVHRLRPVLDA
ncbi:MAG: GH32 [uncultured Nocardioidaceae bacterium]|uniref:beta-fructofuranosidase n=1 Tax=uncultured Nocardioidaceae bacterium TaxID=253824 RepID=A0A6J4MQ96_9ACTN|nr:MAG: GH32 [uncultured Nocardioidaceae bacterium]